MGKLRQIEALVSQGKTVPLACKDSGITDQTYYRWRKEYGGLFCANKGAHEFVLYQRRNRIHVKALAG